MSNDQRWKPTNTCDCCGKEHQEDEEAWWETHASAGLSGFTFVFCHQCEETRKKDCDDVINKSLRDWTDRCREYHKNNPPEQRKLEGVWTFEKPTWWQWFKSLFVKSI